MLTRPAAVAGQFYPADPLSLNQQLDTLLEEGEHATPVQAPPKALIVPHAGYIYSGQTAAIAYQRLRAYSSRFKRVVLLGLSHRVPFRGIATTTAERFSTPLGDTVIDRKTIAKLISEKTVIALDEAHRWEHSLEVQLPFLQRVLQKFELIPLATGTCSVEDAAACLGSLWDDDNTLILISSDLSHFHPYDEACEIDQNTCQRILKKATNLVGEEACGFRGINGLLHYLRDKPYHIEMLDYRNSGDTAGDRERVVGYSAFAVYAA